MAQVFWRDAQGKEGSVALGAQEIQIGRATECAIRTEDAMVSRIHARIVPEGGQHVLEDLGSANGVFYQEQRVARHTLRHGDAVRCGSLWLRFVDESSQQVVAPAGAGPQPAIGMNPTPAGPAQTPAAAGAPPSTATPSPAAAQPPRSRAPARETEPAPIGPGPAETDESLARMRRRLEQAQAELRMYRGGGERATQMATLETEVARLTEERDRLRTRVDDLEATLALEGSDAKVRRAGLVTASAAEIVAGLDDVLSNLRINAMAAEGEFDQFAGNIPKASFELIRESLRASAQDADTARDLLRKLRDIASKAT